MTMETDELVRWQALNMATGGLGPAGSEESARALAEATSGARMLLTGWTPTGAWMPVAEFSGGVWGEPGALSLDVPRSVPVAPKPVRARSSRRTTGAVR